jgi:hypothetical protein
MTEVAAMNAFIRHMLQYTIRLVRVEPNKRPVGLASGFIIPVEKQYRMISAAHAIGAYANWTVETLPVSSTETLMLVVPTVRKVAIPPKSKSDSLDLAWADLNPELLKDQLMAAPRLPSTAVELPLYTGPLDREPDPQVPYGYAAWNRVSFDPTDNTLIRENSCELNMCYVDTDADTGLYKFELARKHQGHGYYRGASGAPIAEPEGVIVSMLVCGDEDDDFLYGVPLKTHARVLLAR